MAVNLTPETEKRLQDVAALSGRSAEEVAEDALASYLDELAEVGALLNRRYDDFKSGKVQPIDGEKVFREMKARTQAQRERRT